jgi:dTDP-4-dehydrorhamnose 3,5-epimerase
MQIQSLDIPDVKLVTPKRIGDNRGFFSETYNATAFAAGGISTPFVQDNQSLSAEKGTIRGLHFQTEPFAQAKLVRVIKGAIFDVAVDIRKDSPSFGRHVSAILSEENWQQLYIPVGFAHGFCTLEPNTEVIYKVTNFYSAANDRGLLWNDPALGIDWPVDETGAVLSDKDKKHPALAALSDVF